ncbi:craniofacial development protein 2-like [Saccostrea echinata]|uniref:craniofacial development protein 2-like n=1 Tax=Saccostrea echinata TaxID=191078 RepID=UPI002A83D820|nr:craniofacial development protein 2-like [Saccostrea echinata]
MNAGNQSHKDVTSKMRDDLNTTKTKLRLGHWNVRTMYEIGKLSQVTSEMRQFNLHVLGVSESRWTGSGKMKTTTGQTVLYSGRDDNLHHEGVAIILRKGVERCLLEWKPINNRLISARLKGKHINTKLIQCYAPTNDSSDEAKDNFYSQLQAEIEKTPRHDLFVIMGDLNAKVGKKNTDYERVMGKHGVGTRNDNGERLVEFCAMNNLVIGGTLFTHRDIHKLTSNSPDGRDKNQIDLLMINGMWRRSLIDVRVKRSADVGSDHHLVTALIKIKLKKTEKHSKILQDIADEGGETNVDNTWKQVAQLYTESSKKKLGLRKRNTNKDWIQQETLIAIEERKEIKKKMLQIKSPRLHERQEELYSEASKRVKKLARRDKREAMDQLAAEAEEAAVRGEQGRVYKITKRVCGKFRGNAGGPIKDKHGTLLTTEKEQEER